MAIPFVDDIEEYFSRYSLTAGDEEICPSLGIKRRLLKPGSAARKRVRLDARPGRMR